MESNKENKFLSAYDQDKKKTNNRKVDALPRGAYEIEILSVSDNQDKEYLTIEFDIAKGKYKNYFTKRTAATGEKYRGVMYRSYKAGNAEYYFQLFITDVTKCNDGYHYTGDSASLIGKHVGALITYQEYKGYYYPHVWHTTQLKNLKDKALIKRIPPILKGGD